MKKSICAIMCHSDDIEYFAGGTFAKHIAEGYNGLYGVLSRCNSGWTVTEEKGGHYVSSLEIIPQRRKEAEAAAKVYGAELFYDDLLENCYTLRDGSLILPSFTGAKATTADENDIPDGTLLCVASGAGVWENHPIVDRVANIIVEWEPELVLGQCIQNMNPDHFSAAMIVAKAWLLAKKKIDIGPLWLPIMQDPHAFPKLPVDKVIDITGHEKRALEAASCHISQGLCIEKVRNEIVEFWKTAGKKHGLKYAEEFSEAFKS